MTPRQLQCLRAIAQSWRVHGEAPTRPELGHALECTKVTAHWLVKRLERAGAVKTYPRMVRNIELTPKGERLVTQ